MKNAMLASGNVGNIIFHIALNPDGTLQPIIEARLPFGKIEVLKALLQTNRPGGAFYELTPECGYLFTYANDRGRPYPSVMIWKYKVIDGERYATDMEKEDLRIIPYAIKTFLQE